MLVSSRTDSHRWSTVPDGAMRVTASVVVATRSRAHLLRLVLPDLAAAVAHASGAELVIVEQQGASVTELCAELGIAASVIVDDGMGASRARNVGARAARGNVIVFTDDDCAVPSTWVTAHVDALTDPDLVASCGAVHGLSRRGGEDPVELDLRHQGRVPPWLVGHGSNLAVTRDAFDAAGGFDERIGPGTRLAAGEDADLIVRLLLAGGTVRSGVGAAVRHLPWRTDEEDRRNVTTYDVGSGVWVGKALRSHGWAVRGFVRARLQVLWGSARLEGSSVRRARVLATGTVAFFYGVVRGLVLRRSV